MRRYSWDDDEIDSAVAGGMREGRVREGDGFRRFPFDDDDGATIAGASVREGESVRDGRSELEGSEPEGGTETGEGLEAHGAE